MELRNFQCPGLGRLKYIGRMTAVFKWLIKYKSPVYVSGAYGSAAILLYVLGMLSGGDGALGAWYLVYFSALPLSSVFNFAACYADNILPDRPAGFLYDASPILAGIIWIYAISRSICAVTALIRRFKASSV